MREFSWKRRLGKFVLIHAIGVSLLLPTKYFPKTTRTENQHLWSEKDQYGNQYCLHQCGVKRFSETRNNWYGFPETTRRYEFRGVQSFLGYTCSYHSKSQFYKWPGFMSEDD